MPNRYIPQKALVAMAVFQRTIWLCFASTDYGYSNTWWRVMFCDNDGTFIGRLERHHWHEYTAHRKGDDVRWDVEKNTTCLERRREFCYGDNITICGCSGLCRNK